MTNTEKAYFRNILANTKHQIVIYLPGQTFTTNNLSIEKDMIILTEPSTFKVYIPLSSIVAIKV